MPPLSIALHEDTAAGECLRDAEFLCAWERLYAGCPWATVFQSPRFVGVWLEVYGAAFRPVLVEGRDEQGELVGLFVLAVEKASGRLAVAGDKHSEYQAWLALPEHNLAFAPAAFKRLRERFPGGRLNLVFVTAQTPLAWVRLDPVWRRRHWIDAVKRNFLRLPVAPDLENQEAFRRYRQRLRKLARLPGLRFEHCEDAEAFERELPGIIELVDFRQASAYGCLPFADDPLKEPFYRAAARVPGLVHCSLLRVGQELVSAEVNFCDGGTVIHGMLAHWPEYARYSVGRYHLLRLAERLSRQDYDCLDLTPGGEYKEDFASEAEDAFILRLYFRWPEMMLYRLRRRLAGLAPRGLKRALERARWAAPPGGRGVAPYRPDGSETPQEAARVNCLADLLAYRPVARGQPSRWRFLREASRRLENGERCFTRVENGALVHCAWLAADGGERAGAS